jgi:hypothetical protein
MTQSMPVAIARRPGDRAPWLEGWPSMLTAFAVAGGLAIMAICLGWRGSDLPAQVFRSDLVRRDGFVIWNSQWFGGHAFLPYSVLAPLAGALTGPLALGAISGVAAAVLFERILHFAFGRVAWIGALWFAVGTATNLIVGRVTFAMGVALGLLAVYSLQRRRPTLAVVAALLCSLSSPLAGAFLALATAAWALATRDRRLLALVMCATALAPIAVIALLFPNPGSEPYEVWALIWDLSLCAVLAVAAWRYASVRWAAGLYAIAIVGCYFVPSALGGNISRFGQYVAGPVLACALLPRRRLVLAALAIPLVIWQFYPAIDGIAFARTDPSTRRSYYTPVLSYLEAQSGAIGRVEIPSTFRHWEAAYAAPHVMLARGWERQLDIAYSPIFYDEGALTASSYRQWLDENGVRFVALPDAQLDDSSLGERALLKQGLPYLDPVWRDSHWQVWRVRDFHGLVASANATLTSLTSDGFVLQVRQPGDVTVRVHGTRHWRVHDAGCAAKTDDGWTVLRNVGVGTVRVSQSLAGTPCPTP